VITNRFGVGRADTATKKVRQYRHKKVMSYAGVEMMNKEKKRYAGVEIVNIESGGTAAREK
jgi:hypothetical protein